MNDQSTNQTPLPESQSSPSAAPVSAPGSGAATPEMDWGTFTDQPALDSSTARNEPTPAAAAAQGPVASHAPATQAAPSQQPAAPQQPVAQPADPASAPQPPTPNALDIINSPEWQKERLAQLEQGYQLTPEEAEAFLDDPVKALPALMAKAHMRLMFQTTQMMDTMMSSMFVPVVDQRIGLGQQRERALAAAEVHIFNPYPKLREVPEEDMKSYVAAVGKIKAANPSMTGGEALRRVATMAYAAHGWELPSGKQTQPAAATKGLPPINPPAAGAVPSAPGSGSQPATDEQGTDWSQFAER